LPLVLLYGANWCFASLWAQKKPATFYSPGFLEALFLLNNVYFFAALTNYINSFFWRNGCFKKQFAAKLASIFDHFFTAVKVTQSHPGPLKSFRYVKNGSSLAEKQE
jgi:hypothetical protein